MVQTLGNKEMEFLTTEHTEEAPSSSVISVCSVVKMHLLLRSNPLNINNRIRENEPF